MLVHLQMVVNEELAESMLLQALLLRISWVPTVWRKKSAAFMLIGYWKLIRWATRH